ncbi:RNA-binding protein 34 [Neopsephotus bourkii]|uniref:RNA-binding protein 34 n=1 Tax=Neopsephotus bourkii TaxID=309878 RepID=UPI002AA5A83A|nr:RNA-binding protein 34 [Neopsephotus bourkii]
MKGRRRVAAPAVRAGPEQQQQPQPEQQQYVVGQVADSLWPAAAPAAPLSGLFSAAAAPPVLVSVKEKKRKHAEEVEKAEVEKASEDQSLPVIEEPPVKAKKARKKELSKADKKLANRESALEQADEEEEQKLLQSKTKQKKKSSAITKSIVKSDTGTTAKQQREKKVVDELVNRRTVFVGNLPVNCTPQVLKSRFKEYGQIKSIRFRSLVPAEDTLSKKLAAIKRKVHPNAKFVNAYIVFKEECDAIKALKENGTEIVSGFHIRVDIASKSSSHDNKRSVFVGNLSYDISDDAVREHFSVCGGVVAVRIVRDRNTGLGKGFGYVLFEDTDAVHLALRLNGTDLVGRKVRVQRCGDKGKVPRKSPGQPRAPKGGAGTAAGTKQSPDDSFVGETATPLRKSGKPKRLRTAPGSKTGKKNKRAFDKTQTYTNVRHCYKE